MVPAFALLVAAACSGDAFTDVQGDLDRLLADPSQVFLEIGESKTVTIEGVDASGGPVTATYEVTDPGAGFDVRRDSTFLPVYVDDSTLQVPPAAERFRFVVTGESYGTSSFTVSAGGKEITIPVQVVPQNTLEAGISNQTPGINEIVTITAPAGARFTAASTVRLPDTTAFAQPFTVSVAADGSTLDVILPPNLIDSRLNITNVVTDGAPSVTFAPSTALTVTTTEVPSFTGAASNLTPAVNEPVTVTLTGATLDPEATLVLGTVPPTVTNLTTNAVTFVPAPGTTGQLTINGVVLDVLPQIPVSLPAPATDTIVVPADPPTLAGTLDPSTAPSVPTPLLNFGSALYDKPPFDGDAIVDAFYQIDITEAGLYTIQVDWTVGADLDFYFCSPEGLDQLFAGADEIDCNFDGASANHPEAIETELEPGTYYFVVDDFGAYDCEAGTGTSTVPCVPDLSTAPAIGTILSITTAHAPPEEAVVAKVKAKSSLKLSQLKKALHLRGR